MSVELIVKHIDDVSAVPCPCGTSQRFINRDENPNVSVHRTEIEDAELHYHEKTTEIYYILNGSGTMVLDNEHAALEPGVVIQIPPGVKHKVTGKVTAFIVAQPAFDPNDEFIVNENVR